MNRQDAYALRQLTSGLRDRYWSGIPVMREDGAMQVRPLTVDRLDLHAHRYWRHEPQEEFILTPDGEIER